MDESLARSIAVTVPAMRSALVLADHWIEAARSAPSDDLRRACSTITRIRNREVWICDSEDAVRFVMRRLADARRVCDGELSRRECRKPRTTGGAHPPFGGRAA